MIHLDRDDVSFEIIPTCDLTSDIFEPWGG